VTTGADQPLRILVIGDEAIVAMLIGDIIESTGHLVAGTADTLADAIRPPGSLRPDLPLCDIKLLDGDSGLAAAAALKPPNIPGIFISGNCPAPDLGQGLALGCVMKPFRPGAVEDAIMPGSRHAPCRLPAAAWPRPGG
jgi:CheY-like chemotaxis protein